MESWYIGHTDQGKDGSGGEAVGNVIVRNIQALNICYCTWNLRGSILMAEIAVFCLSKMDSTVSLSG